MCAPDAWSIGNFQPSRCPLPSASVDRPRPRWMTVRDERVEKDGRSEGNGGVWGPGSNVGLGKNRSDSCML